MQNILMHEIYGNVISTVIALAAILLTSLFVVFFSTRNIDSRRRKRRFRVRTFYVASGIFLFLLARIWVEGFTHLLAVLGLVSAALVVTNKESIMNFVGWLIITWRGLFSEDDLIQIQQYSGYVVSMGMLYFTLAEVSSGVSHEVTGRVIRVPNGLVANNALINFSQTAHLLEQVFDIIIARDSDHEFAMRFLEDIINSQIKPCYKDRKEYSLEFLRKQHKEVADRMSLDVKVTLQPVLDKSLEIHLLAKYYCFSSDAEKLQQAIWKKFLSAAKDEPAIKLV